MSKTPTKVFWEYGDTTLWVSFGRDDKPFPVSIFRRSGNTDFTIHNSRKLTEEENQILLDFLKQREIDVQALWPDAFKPRLNWTRNNLRKKQ